VVTGTLAGAVDRYCALDTYAVGVACSLAERRPTNGIAPAAAAAAAAANDGPAARQCN